MTRPEALLGSDDAGLFGALEPALFLVDGNNLLWRAAHASPAPFNALDGRDLTPLFRFFTMLRRAVGTYGLFAEVIVCFDGPRAWQSRVDIDPSYKANRTYDDKDLGFMEWLPEIRKALDCARIAWIEVEDCESDDVIATMAFNVAPREVRVLSTDRDYYQLLRAGVTVVNPKASPPLIDADGLVAAYGVSATQWCDFRALAGDPSDGIAGMKGVGPKRAADLLTGGKRLEDLDVGEDVHRWRELIRLRTDVSLPLRPSGERSPAIPGPVVVCRELGLA